jgi:hypothetical protein
MLLIGSRALMLRASYLLKRKPLDFDFICTKDEFDSWLIANEHKVEAKKIYPLKDGSKMIIEGNVNCEFDIITPGSTNEMFARLAENDPESIKTSFGLVPNLDLLFTLKTSHRYLKNSPHFWKTLADWHLMRMAGATIRPEYADFLKIREKETYNYKHPKLATDKKEFFSEEHGVTYKYDHDSIHRAIALQERPAYTYYIKDGQEVDCDKNKFFAIDQQVRINGVIEEACVLAIERALVPHPDGMSPEKAWRFALSKVCSSITSGWFRSFAYSNALEIIKQYPVGYWEKFQLGITSGVVKLHDPTKAY